LFYLNLTDKTQTQEVRFLAQKRQKKFCVTRIRRFSDKFTFQQANLLVYLCTNPFKCWTSSREAV